MLAAHREKLPDTSLTGSRGRGMEGKKEGIELPSGMGCLLVLRPLLIFDILHFILHQRSQEELRDFVIRKLDLCCIDPTQSRCWSVFSDDFGWDRSQAWRGGRGQITSGITFHHSSHLSQRATNGHVGRELTNYGNKSRGIQEGPSRYHIPSQVPNGPFQI